jgi:hypothetical protein
MRVIVVIMATILAAVGEARRVALKREKVRELLFAGGPFRRVIKSCYQHIPGRARCYPDSLEELPTDPRCPSKGRHLKKGYQDPISGSMKWGLAEGPARIVWQHSLSEEEPLKKKNFSLVDRNIYGQTKFEDGVFIFALGK